MIRQHILKNIEKEYATESELLKTSTISFLVLGLIKTPKSMCFSETSKSAYTGKTDNIRQNINIK